MRSSAVAAELARWTPALERALRRSGAGETIGMVETEVLAERATLWAADRSCAVTQLALMENGELRLHFWLCGGDLREVLASIPVIERWGAQQGCKSAVIAGRRGWAKALAARGYEPFHGVLRKVL